MDRLTKIPMAERVEAALEAAIRSGELGPQLPGYRELQSILGVSRTAIRPALAALVRRGLLVQRGPRRRFEVVGQGPADGRRAGHRKVLMLEPSRFGDRLAFSAEIAADLSSRAATENWAIEHSVVKADQSRANPGRWQRLLDASGADVLIVVAGSRKTLEWACDCGVPALALGGDAEGLPLPSVGYCTDSMVRIAVDQLLASGHRDVCVPFGSRSTHFVEKVRSAVSGGFRDHGLPFHEKLHFPRWHSNIPEAWRDGLRWRFGVGVPDALVLMGVGSYQTTLGILMEFGLRIPDDLSVVLVAERRALTWFHPFPACFDLDPLRLANKVVNWIRAPEREQESVVLPPVWVEGQSLRPRNRSRPGK